MSLDRTVRRVRDAKKPLRRLRVVVVEGPGAGQSFEPESTGPIGVGTSPDNAVVLADPTVSRYHVELIRLERGVAVRDLGSLNGTFLGVTQLERAVVPTGTKVRLGDTVLVFEDGAEATAARAKAPAIAGLIGKSAAMQELARTIANLAPSNVSVLVHGETGTGKELVARALHERSPRKDKPLVVVDCGSLAPTLIASELFGHERGAFTGADRRSAGAFERADGGTVFLDEIGELPLSVQPSLLGVLERRTYRRVGGDKEIPVDVRVVSATHRDLRAEANRGTFRPDLYFRLAVARLAIPPLRERTEDIPMLIAHFVQEITGADDVSGHFGAEAMNALAAHRYSGNVRELRNVVESALAMGRVSLDVTGGKGAKTAAGAKPKSPRGEAGAESEFTGAAYRDARAEALANFEREYLGALMKACAGNASEAARRAQMDRPYLLGLLRRHGLR